MPATDQKYAIRVLKRLPNGTVGVFYADAETGEILDNLDGYEVVTQGNLEAPDNAADDTSTPSPDTTDDHESRRKSYGSTGGGGANDPFSAPNWRETIVGKLLGKGPVEKAASSAAPKILSNKEVQAAEKSGAVIQDFAPNSMDMGAGLGGTPPELQKMSDNARPYSLFDYETGYGTNDQYYADKASAQKPVSSLDDYKTGYGNDYIPDSNTPKESFIDPAGNYVAPKSAPVNLGYQDSASKTRNQPVDNKILDLASVSAQNIMGPGASAVIYSGGQTAERDPAMKNQPGGWTGTHAHDMSAEGLGQAADIQYYNPDGSPATQEQMALIMADQARMGIGGLGYGENYMGVNTAHSDLGRERTWGGSGSAIQLNPDQLKTLQQARKAYDKMATVIPTPRPDNLISVDPSSMRGASGNNIMSAVNPNPKGEDQTVARGIIDAVVDPAKTTDDLTVGGTAASYGLTRQPDANELNDLAYTFAGELSGDQLQALAAGNPTALAELASMASTYENRLQSGSDNILRGSQYNSNLGSNKTVTDENYRLYGDALKQELSNFYTGGLAGLGMTDATHYHNPNISSPSWSSVYPDGQTIGDHLFQNAQTEYQSNVGQAPGVLEAGANRVNYQYDNSSQLDNSSLISSAPKLQSDNQRYAESAASTFSGISRSSSADSGAITNSSGNSLVGASAVNNSPVGSYGVGSSGSKSITSSAPNINTSGITNSVSDSQASANRDATFSDWFGWI